MSGQGTYAAVVFGVGGIGRALTERLIDNPRISKVWAVSRRPIPFHDPKVIFRQMDASDETALTELAADLKGSGQKLRLAIVTHGVLQDDKTTPEKSWKALDPSALAHLFAVNTILPAIIAKHFLPLLPRDERSVFAALSARVGSISDNRLGGWYGYRASKAALNQIIHTLAIELARSHPMALCVALHPGTVETPLSAAFPANANSGPRLTPRAAAEALLNVLAGLQPKDSGGFFAWDGEAIPY
jgi:NAD(P)-dependent dehydrogenase (short-subunit alcohol dehydrogenase family)